jgi:small subunit ribosomal protein S24e
MDIEIIAEVENKTLFRKEIDFRIDHVGTTTPSRSDIRAKIGAQFDADSEAVVVKKLETKYGIGVTEGSARIYSDLDQMKRIELDYILKRHESEDKKEES